MPEGSLRILVVDDDKEDHMTLQDYFAEVGLSNNVHYLLNGLEALKFLNSIPDTSSLPELIIMDLNMPKLNGTQTLQELKSTAKLKNIPVVIYSTSENDTEKRKTLSLGALDYLVKPMSVEEGRLIVKKFLSYLE